MSDEHSIGPTYTPNEVEQATQRVVDETGVDPEDAKETVEDMLAFGVPVEDAVESAIVRHS